MSSVVDKEQEQAVKFALTNQITIIKALAGCGKSFTANRIATILAEQGWVISKIAPTGKAAVRINGSTIHTWMKPDVDEDKYGNCIIKGYLKEALDFKECVIIDECSMIDDNLWEEVWRIWDNSKTQKKLILVGDDGQLEPVGDGTPFIKYIKDNPDLVQELKTIHRNETGNDIVDFAHKIRHGQDANGNWENVKVISLEQAVSKIIAAPFDVQAMSPMRKGNCGTNNINQFVQSQLGLEEELIKCIGWDNEKKIFDYNGRILYKGDKIVITRNNFAFDVVNGTVGRLIDIGYKKIFNTRWNLWERIEGVYIHREYDDQEVFVPLEFATKHIDLAYSLTVHKMQGSESNEVILFATPDQFFMLKNQKLFYTAITRAKKNLYLAV